MQDKTILITGATGSIGTQLSIALAQKNVQCILLGRNIGKLEKLYDQIIENKGKKPALYPIDFRGAKPEDYDQLANIIRKEFSQLNGIIHTAAVFKESTSIEYSDPTLWLETFQVNLHASYLLTRACIPLLKRANEASIIYTQHQFKESIALLGAFAVSQSAIKSFTEVLNDELNTDNTNIKVELISPGDIRSAMNVRIHPGIDYSSHAAADAAVANYLSALGIN